MINKHLIPAARILRNVAHPLRLAILCHLQQGPKNVGELASMTETNQSSLSHHLARLRLAGILDCERRQQHVYYYIANEEAGRFVASLDTLYCNKASHKEMS